jgi:hypothetical protein
MPKDHPRLIRARDAPPMAEGLFPLTASPMFHSVDDWVSVPNAGGQRVLLLKRYARLLASGGLLDTTRMWIKGGDPACESYPDGTMPLSTKEAEIVRERFGL